MKENATPPDVRASDPVARAVEEHLHQMEADGLGNLVFDSGMHVVRLTFGKSTALAENYDVALVRLAGKMLDDPSLAKRFLGHLRGSVGIVSH